MSGVRTTNARASVALLNGRQQNMRKSNQMRQGTINVSNEYFGDKSHQEQRKPNQMMNSASQYLPAEGVNYGSMPMIRGSSTSIPNAAHKSTIDDVRRD